MTPQYPNSIQIPFNGPSGGLYVDDAPFRGVLHTAESKDYHPSTTSYFGHSNPPHFTVAKKGSNVKVYQHYSINVASRTLANPTKPVDDVQTNRLAAIQIEICWYAAQIASLPNDMKNSLRALMRWIEAEANIQRNSLTFYGDEAYGEGGVARMSTRKWKSFNGWCGHQHVPENAHWDPGKIDIAYLLT
jgi:hypothetical protein